MADGAATDGTVPDETAAAETAAAETTTDASGAVLTAGADATTGAATGEAAGDGKAATEAATEAGTEAGTEAEAEAVGAAADEQAPSSVLMAARLSRPPRRAAADRRPTTYPRYVGSGFERSEDGGAQAGRLHRPRRASLLRDAAEHGVRIDSDFVVGHCRRGQ